MLHPTTCSDTAVRLNPVQNAPMLITRCGTRRAYIRPDDTGLLPGRLNERLHRHTRGYRHAEVGIEHGHHAQRGRSALRYRNRSAFAEGDTGGQRQRHLFVAVSRFALNLAHPLGGQVELALARDALQRAIRVVHETVARAQDPVLGSFNNDRAASSCLRRPSTCRCRSRRRRESRAAVAILRATCCSMSRWNDSRERAYRSSEAARYRVPVSSRILPMPPFSPSRCASAASLKCIRRPIGKEYLPSRMSSANSRTFAGSGRPKTRLIST
jgi:hypothetical protein